MWNGGCYETKSGTPDPTYWPRISVTKLLTLESPLLALDGAICTVSNSRQPPALQFSGVEL